MQPRQRARHVPHVPGDLAQPGGGELGGGSGDAPVWGGVGELEEQAQVGPPIESVSLEADNLGAGATQEQALRLRV